ncbi:cell wall-binding repeat-containing protein [Kallipyga massiliensis]|uniref:cell wall-binding repeat-containing protein n=1 Tax=Kallipyga massiliensis TaxID=1472764 RepID=UPI0004B454EA|nr:cell wall-binding repeat-containing protein [Kallipyga massiliensis]
MKGLRRRMLALVLALVMVLGFLPGTRVAQAEGGIDITVKTAEDLRLALREIRTKGENEQENIIRLGADIDDLPDGELTFGITKNTILLGQGHTINMKKFCFAIVNGATLSLGRENPQGNENDLTITSSASKDDPRKIPAIFVGAGAPGGGGLTPGNLKMYDGVEIKNMVTSGDYWASAVNVTSGTFDMYGGKIHNNQSHLDKPYAAGSVIFLNGRPNGVEEQDVAFNMMGGEVSDNIATVKNTDVLLSSAIYLVNGHLNIQAGRIMNNRMKRLGTEDQGLLYGTAIGARDSELNLKGANRDSILISGNTGAASGGAISLQDSTFTAENATIEGNSSSLYGGALTTNGKVTLKNVLIKNNKSKQGGGIFLDDNAELICNNNTLFQGNMATEDGGAIFDKNSVDQSDFSGENYEELTANTDYYRGITMDNTTGFDQNKAEGGLFVPPANWSDFSNLGYSQDPAFHNPTGIPSPLNNDDINYKNDFFFVAYDGNGAEGSMPTSAYKNGQTVTVKLPENGFKVPEGKVFDGWMINGEKKAVDEEITVETNTMVVAQWKTVQKPNPKPDPKPDIPPETGKVEQERIAGEDRIETAIALSKKNFDHADYVVLARSDNYADALTAGVLAKGLNAPILLTKTRSLDGGVKTEISRLGVKEVILIGGDNALSKEVETAVKTNCKSSRIGGADRYETSALIARRIAKLKGNPEKVILATGLNYADALSISPYAGKMAYPILLTKTNSLPDVIEKTIQDLKVSSALALGGKAALTDAVVRDLPQKIERIGGETRYDTSAMIAERFFPKATMAYLASGEDFADALAAGPVAAKADCPVLLTKMAGLPTSMAKHIQKAAYEKIIIVGGVKAVSQAVLDAIK